MCGRFTLYESAAAIVERFMAEAFAGDLPLRYNIAPTDTTPIVSNRKGHRTLELCRWGLVPSWADDPSIGSRMINARAESLAEKPAFRDALTARRCIVPANGFYEWKLGEKKLKSSLKQPVYIRPIDSTLFGLAGLYEVWKQPDGEWLKTFTIVTVPANETLNEYHFRMPAILTRDDAELWLDPDCHDVAALVEVLHTTPMDGLDCYQVSTTVNTAGVDGPSLIRPLIQADASGDLTLDL
jgi:putative SOS response-associated peptidase YedK